MRTWLARAAISALAVAGLVWFVPVTEVWRALGRVSLWHWGTALLVFSAGHAANAMKLRLLVGTSHASATRCLRAHFAGLAANLGLPGVSGGDVVRGAYLVPVAGTARVAVAAIVDRAIDGVVLAAIGAGALVAAGRPPVTVGARPAGAVALLLVLAAIGAVLAARHLGRRSGRRPAVRAALKDLRDRPRSIVVAAVLSLTVQMAFVGTHVWLASKVGAPAALAPWLVAWTGAKLSAVLPVSLGGLGVRDAALVAVLVSYGAPADAVLAVGLLWDGALIAGSVGGFLGTVAGADSMRLLPPHDYGVTVVLLTFADRVVPAGQVEPLRQAILVYLTASSLTLVDMVKAEAEFARARTLAAALPEPARTLMTLVNERAVDQLGPRLFPVVDAAADDAEARALSPERVAPPTAPVFLLHGSQDTVIPPVETLFLAAHLHGRTEVTALLSSLITHAEVDKSAAFGDVWALTRFWRALMRY